MVNQKKRKQLYCNFCSKKFLAPYLYLRHLDIHNVKPYGCNICGEKFETALDLKAHMKLRRSGNRCKERSGITEQTIASDITGQDDGIPTFDAVNGARRPGLLHPSAVHSVNSKPNKRTFEVIEIIEDTVSDPSYAKSRRMEKDVFVDSTAESSTGESSHNFNQFQLSPVEIGHSNHDTVDETYDGVIIIQPESVFQNATPSTSGFVNCPEDRQVEEEKKYFEAARQQQHVHQIAASLVINIDDGPSHALQTTESEVGHSCEVCKSQFKNELDLDAHLQIHKAHTCLRCGEVFGNTFLLEQHRRLHLKNSKKTYFVCADCGKTYTRKSYLAYHKRIAHRDHGQKAHKNDDGQKAQKSEYGQVAQKSHTEIAHRGEYGQIAHESEDGQIAQKSHTEIAHKGEYGQPAQMSGDEWTAHKSKDGQNAHKGEYRQTAHKSEEGQKALKSEDRQIANKSLKETIARKSEGGQLAHKSRKETIAHKKEDGQKAHKYEYGLTAQKSEDGQKVQKSEDGQKVHKSEDGQIAHKSHKEQIDRKGEYDQTTHKSEYGQAGHKSEDEQIAHKGEYGQLAQKSEYGQIAHKIEHGQISRNDQNRLIDRNEKYGQIAHKDQNGQIVHKNQYGKIAPKSRYRCSFCRGTFESKVDCDEHEETHLSFVIIQCPKCERKFSDERSLQEHLKSHSKSQEVQMENHAKTQRFGWTKLTLKSSAHEAANSNHLCMACRGTSVDTKSSDNNVPTRSKPYTCHHCDESFYYQTQRSRHELIHVPYDCALCGFRFADERTRNEHKQTHRRYQCDDCCKQFKGRLGWIKHVESRHSSFPCAHCMETFTDEQSRSEHLETHTKSYGCGKCNEAFYLKIERDKHETAHTTFKCLSCRRYFFDEGKDSTDQHHSRPATQMVYTKSMSVENLTLSGSDAVQKESCIGKKWVNKDFDSSQKPNYSCHICESKFEDEKLRDQHLVVHNPNVYPCKTCSKLFTNEAALQRHTQTHKNTSVICPVCKRKFESELTLNRHFVSHKAHTCRRCGEVFKNQKELIEHMLTICKELVKDEKLCDKETPVQNLGSPAEHNIIIISKVVRQNLTNNNDRLEKDRIFRSINKGASDQDSKAKTHEDKGPLSTLRGLLGIRPESDRYACHFCSKVLKTLRGLHNHERSHRGKDCIKKDTQFSCRPMPGM